MNKFLISLLLVCALATVQSNAQTGLVGYWNFDEGTGTTVTDISGNGLTGTFNTNGNGSLKFGESDAFQTAGHTLAFEGTNADYAYVNVPDNPLFNDLQVNMTIEAWIFQKEGSTNNTIIDRGNYNFLFQAIPYPGIGKLGLGFYSNQIGWKYSSTTIETNEWVHVAMTLSQKTRILKFYKNGVLTDSIKLESGLSFSGAGPVNIGRQSPTSCRCNLMNGKLDEIRLWRVVRTDAEILANYKKTIAIVDQVSTTDLANLTSTGGTFTQSFEPGIIEYGIANVNNATTSIVVTPTKSDADATIQVRVNVGSFANVASGTASDALDLIVGSNTVDVKVTAADGTTKIYTITVTREMAYPSYIVSGAGNAEVNGIYTRIGTNNSGNQVYQYGNYYLTSDAWTAWIGEDPDYEWGGYYSYTSETDPTKWTNWRGWPSPMPVIKLASSKLSYAASTLIENSANDGAVTATTTITHNNYQNATFTGADGENFISSGKALVTGVPAGLTAVITRNNNLQLTFSLTGNASAHANANDISNLNITFQDAAFSDNDAANTTNYSTNLSINFIEQINVGSGETYTTIQSAVNAAVNGDVLLLAAEIFTEQNISIANKSLTIIGVSPAKTIVQAHANAGEATDRVFNITNNSYAETNFHTFEKLTVRHGNSFNKGGGLYAFNTTLRLKDCAIESNTTTLNGNIMYEYGGGGVHVEKSNLISENCTFYNNYYSSIDNPYGSGGGAIAFIPDVHYGGESFMDISNCTFSDNSSETIGGAIFNTPTDAKSIRITNSTFVGNSAKQGGALSQMGWGYIPQPTYIKNCLFYGNTASLDGSTLHAQYTTTWAVNNCLIETTSKGGQLNAEYTDCIVGVDPLLGDLEDNGGYTKTYSIGSESPAINKGITTERSRDQRGYTIEGASDIGAYEYGGSNSENVLPALPTMTVPEGATISVACGGGPVGSILPFTNGLSGDSLIEGNSNPSTFSPVDSDACGGGSYIETWTAVDSSGRELDPVSRKVTVVQDMGALESFVFFSSDGAVGNTGASQVKGDIGTSKGAITGFGSPSEFNGSKASANPLATQAKKDLMNLYIHLANIPVTSLTHAPVFGNGETLSAGVYSIAAAGSLVGNLTLDAEENPSSLFILKYNGAFSVGAASKVILINGAKASNVFWIAEGAISVGAASTIKGNLLAHTGAVSMGAGCDLEGRMFSTTGAVTLDSGNAYLPSGPSDIPIICVNSAGFSQEILGSVANFTLFTSAGAVSNVGASGIIGDVGSNAGAITGFETSANALINNVYNADQVTAQAKMDLERAYQMLSALKATKEGTPTLTTGIVLLPGFYSTIGAGTLTGTVTLDAQGDDNALFVIRFGGAFSTEAQSRVNLINGARYSNVFWVAEGAISLGASSFMKGNLISHNAAVSMGARGNLEGRMLSTGGAIGFNTAVAYTSYLKCVTSGEVQVKNTKKIVSTKSTISKVLDGGIELETTELIAYPNPFTSSAIASFALPYDEANATLILYDLRGAVIQVLYNGNVNVNQKYEIPFNSQNLTKGIYFFRLSTSNEVKNLKVIMK